MKICTKCGEQKPLEAFSKNKARKDGRENACLVCKRAYVASRQQQVVIDHKTCTKCNTDKLAAEFGVRKASVDGLQFKCRKCVAAEAAEHRAQNPELTKEKNRIWYAKHGKDYAERNREKLNEKSRKSRLKNPEAHRARVASWQARNPDYGAAHYAENKEQLKVVRAQHYENNKEEYMTRGRNKRAAVKCAGRHTTKETENLFQEQRGFCANILCGKVLVKGDKHLDHITPLSRGGSNTIENLQWLCKTCNLSKFNRTEEVWYKEQIRRLLCQ